MGPIRRGLIATALLPSPALAEVCAQARPGWDGTAVSALQEALFLSGTLPALVLFVASVAAMRFRSQWGALAVVVAWTVYVSLLTMAGPAALRAQAAAEGCVGSPSLFIALVAAICVAMTIYTTPRTKPRD